MREEEEVPSTVIELIGPYPVSESCTVVIGAITTSSSFWVPFEPFDDLHDVLQALA